MKYLLIVASFLVASCQSGEEEHAHDADGGHIENGMERPSLVSTIWTDSTELFVEYPALVVNEPSRFAAHFTMLDEHEPVREGSVTVSLIKDGQGIRQTVEAPASPGIFTPTLVPKEAGIHRLVFDIKTPQYQDRIIIDNVQVYADAEQAIAAIDIEEEPGGTIPFLKEQAWKIDFETAPVVQGEIYNVIHTSGVWKAAPGTYRTLTAKTNGVVNFSMENLTEGTIVDQGQLLMTISSEGLTRNNLQAEIERARANFEQAEAEYERKRELYELEIIPRSEFEQVESRYQIARTTLETLQSGTSNGGTQIRAPFDGFIRSININNGGYVEQGAALVNIGASSSHLLQTQVSPSYAGSLQDINNIWYRSGLGEWSSIKATGGSVQSIGQEVEANQPLIPIYAQTNEGTEMLDGSFTEVQIGIGDARQSLLVPEAALLEDYGSYAVITQLSGETFERKPVQIGRRNGEYVEILEGLEAGEIVVTEGAYQVLMASMSGQAPAHGHAH